ncbi:MAG: hypothetical protein AAGI52_10990 [Bacteroidota bacterium]
MTVFRLAFLVVLTAFLVYDAAAQVTRGGRSPMPVQRTVEAPNKITGYDRGNVRTLSISGTTGTHSETVMAPGDGWIYGIEMGERSDQPCYLGIWATEGTAPAPGYPVAFDRCDGDVREGSVAALGFEKANNREDWRRARRILTSLTLHVPIYSEVRSIGLLFSAAFDNSNPAPPLPVVGDAPVALDGVGICQRNSNDEMKGLRIHGSRLDLDGSRVETSPIVTTSAQTAGGVTIPAGARVNEEFKRPNCSANNGGWKPIRTCAANEVLVGLDIHYKFPGITGNQDRARITGLAPKCARVTIERR